MEGAGLSCSASKACSSLNRLWLDLPLSGGGQPGPVTNLDEETPMADITNKLIAPEPVELTDAEINAVGGGDCIAPGLEGNQALLTNLGFRLTDQLPTTKPFENGLRTANAKTGFCLGPI